MKIEIGPLRQEPGDYEYFDFHFSPAESVDECRLLSDVHVAGNVTYGGNEFLLSGRLTAMAALPCSRCLTPVEQEIALDFTEEFDEEDYPGEDAVMDVADIATQLWVTTIPMRSLCRDECKGLCPQCGKDLNEGECDCPTADVDPRLEALRGFVPDTE